ncbi:MAG: response regulator [Candidatus Thermoplasmatota archaeon]|nr:response regulator [Candidatus Thermoplasmatota archaeon]
MTFSLEKARILILEDEKFIANVIEVIVKKAGHMVDKFTDPEEALKNFKEVKHDIILLDLHLPGSNGLDLIKEFNLIHDAKIIIVSGVVDEGIKDRCLEAGASDFISKPFKASDLNERISSQL